MSQKFSAVALRASILYGLVAGSWILFSDRILGGFVKDKQELVRMEIYKGWVFVVFTAALLFFVMRHLLRRESVKIEELKQADSLTRLQQDTLQMIAGGQPLKTTLETLLRGIEAHSPDMLVSVLLLEGTQLWHGAAPSMPEEYIKAIDGADVGPMAGSCGTAAFRGSPVFVSDIASDPLWADYKHLALAHGLRACWSTPILDEQKKMLGTFAIYQRTTGLPRTGDVRVIELVTHTAATAIVKERVEKNLRGSEERFRTLVEQASDGIFVHDVEGRLLDVNRSACESLGYTRREMLRMNVTEFEQGALLEEVRHIWRGLKPGNSQIVRGRHRRKNGTTYPVEVNVACYEIQGQRVFAALTRNLSGRKEYEDQLAQSVSLMRATLESSGSGILVVNAEGKIATYNNRFLEMWRIPAELVTQNDDQALLKVVLDQLKEPDNFLKRVQELYEQPEADGYDTLYFKDGRVYDRVARPQRLGDKIIGRVWSFRDMTRQARAEKSMQLQSVALEAAANAILITDAHGSIEWANPAFTRTSGYTLEESLGKNPRDLITSGKHSKEFFEGMWKTILAGNVWHGELTNCRKDGAIYQEEMTITPLMDAEKRISHFVAIKQDITERKKTVEALATSQALYSSLVEQMPACVFRKGADGQFVFVNAQFCELEQLKPAEIIGRNAKEVAEYKLKYARDNGHAPSDIGGINYSLMGYEHHKTIMETGQTIEIYEEYTFPSGEKRSFQAVKSPVFDSNRNIIGSQGIMFDTTENRRTSEKLRRADERTKFYMDRMPLAFIAFDREFRVTEWNHAAEAIFGWSAGEALGQHAYKLIMPPETQPQMDRVWEEIIQRGNSASHSVNENLTKDGRRLTCEWQNMPWRDAANQISGCLSIVTDISDRIRAEKERQNLEAQLRQSQKMEAVGQLSGGVAHDFNNILTVIQGNAAMLQGLDLEPSEIHDCANQIARASDRAAGLTRQLLMFARKQQLQAVNLDLNETVAQMTKMLQRILGEDIILRSEYSPALPLIHADTGMIEQIILNLAVNARDAMPDGGQLTIHTKLENFKPASGQTSNPELLHICLSITDTGSGIAPEILPRIFEPFFTTKEVGKGTGLGLATVYGIVQQHHGEITVQSKLGQGTTFKVYFPAVAMTEAVKTETPAKSILPWGNETILLVEDEFPLRTFVSDLLERCGYTVLEAESGPAALKIWKEQRDRIQLLFTDIIMPENMNGIELGRQLQAEKSSLKVIHTSGYVGKVEDRHTSLKEGINFIRKPFKPEALAEIIRENLDDKTAER